jgi:hypothetical protein
VLVPALVLAEHDRQRDLLDDARVHFIHEAVSGLVEDVAARDIALHGARASKDGAALEAKGSLDGFRVAVVPARDVDAIVGVMLVRALERMQATAEVVNPEAGEVWLGRLEALRPDLILVSAMPPLATLQARPLLRRLRARFADARILAGLWGIVGETGRARERLAGTRTDSVVTTIAQALGDAVSFRSGAAEGTGVESSPDSPRGSFVEASAAAAIAARAETRASGFRLSQMHRPARDDGEDLIEARVDDRGRLLILLGDPVGHGAPAVRAGQAARLAFQAVRPESPEDVLAEIARVMTRETPLAALAAVLDPADGTCRIACAGDAGLLRVHGSEVSVVELPPAPPLGSGGEQRPFASICLPVGASDRLLFYTDGAVEATDERGLALGQRGLTRLVSNSLHRRGKRFLEALEEALIGYSAGPANGDVVLACLEVEQAGVGEGAEIKLEVPLPAGAATV